jgi:hypothetical protein
MQHRLIILPTRTPKAPWRDTRAEALADAIELGLASRDRYVEGRVYLDALAEIEERGE